MPTLHRSWLRLITQGVLLTVIIAIGVFCGIYAATATGIADRVGWRSITPGTMDNQSRLRLNELWPLITVTDLADRPVTFDTVLSGRKTVIGFVSQGCEACRIFAEQFGKVHQESGGAFQLVLLSPNAEFFAATYGCRAYRITDDLLSQYAIGIFPTIVGIGDDGVIKFVSSGYPPKLNAAFVKKYL